MLFKKLRVFYWTNKIWFYMALLIVVLLVLSVWGLSKLDSFFAGQIIYTLPVEILKIIAYSVLGAFFWMMMMFSGRGMPMAAGSNSQVKSKNVKVGFADVIGLTEAKREALEVVALIRDRAKVKQIGGKVVRGLLMVGPPGCGKTYLAKAIAHEAGVPFFSVAGSEFVEVFVGVGASRVRKLFQKAKAAAYLHGSAVVFIDELDAIGQSRKFSMFGSSESDNTLNQLLVAMDGLSDDPVGGNVIVIGATNAAEGVLDPAMLRPGRFDRRIHISKPNLADRQHLFEYYLKKVKSDPTLDVARIARKAVAKSPADIENIVKEAALISLRYDREEVTYKDISAAMERVDLGQETHLEMTPAELERVAYHESGHLLVLYRQHPTDDVFKASVKTRGGALGVVYHSPREELHLQTREELYANIKTALAGYVAERVKYNMTSTGVSGDFANAMSLANAMVWNYGMGTNGFVGDYTILLGDARRPNQTISEDLKNNLNNEVQAILYKATQEVEEFLRKEWPLMDTFAKALMERKELDYDEIEAIFKEHDKGQVLA